MNPKISIITPSFNQAEFIKQTIDSVLDQKYPNLEYIIMDGGSTDGSAEIIKKYAQRYPQVIKWESKQDKGQVDAINRGLKIATGDIIAYLNSDDRYLPAAFAEVAKFFRQNPYKLWLVGNCQVTQQNLRWTFLLKHIWPVHITPGILTIFNFINQPAVFLKRELIDLVGAFNPDYLYAFDYEYWLRCIQIGLPGRIYKELAVFRVHRVSKSSEGFAAQFSEDYEISKTFTQNSVIKLMHFLLKNLTTSSYKFLKSS